MADIKKGDRVRLINSGSLTGHTGTAEGVRFGSYDGLIGVTLDDPFVYGYPIACAPDELERIEAEAVPA